MFEWFVNLVLLLTALIPPLACIYAFVVFSSPANRDWQATRRGRAVRLFCTIAAVWWGLYFLYTIMFVDPEFVLGYIFWPLPTALTIVGLSLPGFRQGTLTEKVIYGVALAMSAVIAIGPLAFLPLRQSGIL